MTLSLESLARTIAKARHGTDAMWANYLPSARAVMEELMAAAETAEPKQGDLFTHFYLDADGMEDNAYLEPEDARVAFRAILRALIAQPDGVHRRR